MLKKCIDYMVNNGHVFMITGFIIVMGSVLVYVSCRQSHITQQVAFSSTIFGLVIYVTGRIFMVNKRIRNKKRPVNETESKDDL